MDANENLQVQEVQAIEAIFGDDFKIIPPTWSTQPLQFMIRLTPPPGMVQEVYAQVWLVFRFTRSYPNNPPLLEVEKIGGLSDEQLSELQCLLEKEAKKMLGREMVYDLTEIATEFLLRHNNKPLSFYDEMILHKKEEEKEALEKEQQRLLEEDNERRKKEEPLERRIREEFKRKEEALRKTRKKQSDWRAPIDDHESEFEEDSEDSDENEIAQVKEKRTSAKSIHEIDHKIRWKRKSSLGKGTFGEVFLGVNLRTKSLMAIKEINFANVPQQDKKMDLVVNEIESLRGFQHPHIVSYLGTEKEENTLRIFLEFVGGAASLAQHLQANGGLGETILRKYTRQILEGLEYLHHQNTVHGDIKCSNMLLDHNGNIKLSDFGCTNARINALLTANAKAFMKNQMNKGNDIFDLGRSVIEMANGMATDVKPGKFPTIPEDLPRQAKDFVQLCLRRNAHERPNVDELLQHPFVTDISKTNSMYLPGSPPSPIISIPAHCRKLEDDSSSNTLSEPLKNSLSVVNSRYLADFEELEELGRGGFGSVVRVKNKLDEREYAIKKIRLHPGNSLNQKILREVTTLSRLNHQYVVRYFQAWTEGGIDNTLPFEDEDESDWLSGSQIIYGKKEVKHGNKKIASMSSSSDGDDYFMHNRIDESEDESEEDDDNQEHDGIMKWKNDVDDSSYCEDDSDTVEQAKEGKKAKSGPSETLYIQMEYCAGDTLRTAIDKGLSDDERWRLFRQILEGLSHIHLQGIIHRDLKPMNIFLDQEKDVKIGDFGLATTDTARVSKKEIQEFNSLSLSNGEDNLTVGVGTPFYCSPEQLKPGMHYDQKVDLYSLGIILFEMCYPMSTAMERAEVLTALRNEMKFPSGFEKEHPTEAELIRWLLQEDPNARPTTMELLKSDLLPPQLEEEILKEALRSITIPGTTIFNMLIEKLFSLVPDEHLDYTYDSHATNKLHSTAELLLREQAFTKITEVFKRHGGTLLETPLLIPKRRVPEEGNVATLMDDSGSVVMLPCDLTLPFARYVAHSGIVSLKRYNIARVYRKNPAGGQPRELYECDFDIIGPIASRSVHDAETIKVLVEVLDGFKHIGSYIIKINHHKLLLAMMDVCGFPKETWTDICNMIEKMWKRKLHQQPAAAIARQSNKMGSGPMLSTSPPSSGVTMPNGRTALGLSLNKYLLKVQGVSQWSVDLLGQFLNISGDIKSILQKVEKLIKGHRLGQEGLDDLRKVIRYLKIFGVLDRVFFDLGLAYNFLYYDGLIFQAVVQEHNEVVAAGGRYDGLVAKFQPPNSSANAVAAVGVNIAIAKLVNSFISNETRKLKNEGRKLRNCETEVYVCFTGENMVEECIQICTELWANNIKAEYRDGTATAICGVTCVADSSGKHTTEEIFLACRQAGVRWLVMVSDQNKDKKNTVRVKDVETWADTEVHKEDIVKYFLLLKSGVATATAKMPVREVGREHVEIAKAVNSGRSHAGVANPKAAGSTPGVFQVVVLNSNLPSRRKKQIALDANRAIGPRMAGVVSPTKTKIWAVELPVQVLRDLVASADKFYHPIQKYPRFKDDIIQLRDALMEDKMPIVFLYSIPDGKCELLFRER